MTTDASGKIANSRTIPLDLHYTGAEREKAFRNGIAAAQDLMLEKDAATLRFVVFDRNSNSFGSLTIPVAPSTAAALR